MEGGFRQKPGIASKKNTRLYAISYIKTGWISLTLKRVLHIARAQSLREAKSSSSLNIHYPSEREVVDKTVD